MFLRKRRIPVVNPLGRRPRIQTIAQVCISWESVNHGDHLSIEIDRRKCSTCCSFRKLNLELYNQLSTVLQLKIWKRNPTFSSRHLHVKSGRVPCLESLVGALVQTFNHSNANLEFFGCSDLGLTCTCTIHSVDGQFDPTNNANVVALTIHYLYFAKAALFLVLTVQERI